MSREQPNKIVEDLKKRLESGKEFFTASLGELLSTLIETLQLSRDKKFVFLLVGRTGVGKSSTVNSLMGKQIAQVGNYDPTTMGVESYDSEINGVQFTIIDTPGLCDDLPEKGNDQKYIELMRSKATHIDSIWFVTRLDDPRVTPDEMRGIKIISEAFTPQAWEHAVIIFTRANKADDYLVDLQERTKRVRDEIAKHTGVEIASNIPSVAIDNRSKTTPDGKQWLGNLYTKVFVRMSERGSMPFFMATSHRINSAKNFSSVGQPNWIFYNASATSQEASEETDESTDKVFEFDEEQKGEIKKKLIELVPALAVAGATVGGSIGGPIGAAIGGALGAAIGSIFYFCS
jgi:small GTP-binding protein